MKQLSNTELAHNSEYPQVYERFKFFYQDYGENSLNLLKSIYSEDIQFKDPVHEIKGINQLSSYFKKGKQNLLSCKFEFVHEQITDHNAYITWNMHFKHKKIQSGRAVSIRGMSHIRFDDGKITLHEDSFDLGSMIYENLPVVGKLVKAIKKKL